MGVKVLEDIIDDEIVGLVNKLNEFPFLQSRSCCSGWSGSDPNAVRSNGVDRVWTGSPYLSFWSLDDTISFKFLVFLMKNLIFDHNALDYMEKIDDYKKTLSLVSLEDDAKQLIHTGLEWRNDKVVVNIYLNAKDRTPEFIDKVFKLIETLCAQFNG